MTMMRRRLALGALVALVLLLGLAAQRAAAFSSPFAWRRPSAPTQHEPKDTSPAWPTLGLLGGGGDAWLPGGALAERRSDGGADAEQQQAAIGPATNAMADIKAAIRHLLPPTPTAAAPTINSPARSLLAVRMPSVRASDPDSASSSSSASASASPVLAAAAATNYTVLDYAYFVATVAPRRAGQPGVCPSGGARGAEGQKLAAVLLRSLRADPAYAKATLKPLQCWVKTGIWDALARDTTAPPLAFWVFAAESWPISDDLANTLLIGDQTFVIRRDSGPLLVPRNASCYTGRIDESADQVWSHDGTKISTVMRSWCVAQNRAGRQALRLQLAYTTHAVAGTPSCSDGLWNAAESGTDCGLPCKSVKCQLGEGCGTTADCPAGATCDSFQIFPPRFDDDGSVSLGGLGTCAQTCAQYAAAGGCAAGTIADSRYGSLVCAANFGKKIACTGQSYPTPDFPQSKACCINTAPCSSITTCDANQFAITDPEVRCSNTLCTGAGDKAKCCITRASCSALFSSSTCTGLDATSYYNAAGYCAGASCSTTTDKAVCCPQRPLCSSTFTSANCKANDPSPDASLIYTASNTARCAGSTCNLVSDWSTCCSAKAPCSPGFFRDGRSCPANTTPVTTGTPLCAGRTCTQTDSATCCAAITASTCASWASTFPSSTPACSNPNFGGVIAAATTTTCASGSMFNCQVVCCTSLGAPVQTCDQLRQSTPTYCGATGGSFLTVPLYNSCSLGVSGSCAEACCKNS